MKKEYSESEKEFPRRRFKIINLLKILGEVLIVLLIFETLGILVGNLTEKPVVAQWGTIEKGFWTDVLFLRDETVLTATTSGVLGLKFVDGTRIPRGEVVATINVNNQVNTPSDDPDLQAKLQNLKLEVQSLQADLDRVNLEINKKMIFLSHNPKNLTQKRSQKEDLALIVQEKKRILRNIENNRLLSQSLLKKINQQPDGTALIITDKPGYLYYRYDEAEKRLNPTQFSDLVAADFNADYTLKSPAKQINTGAVIGKIINPFQQLVTFIIDPRQTGVPVKGDIWWFKIGGNTFPGTIVNQINLADGKMIVALEDVSMPAELMPNRRAKIFIIFKRLSGIIIPIQALFKKGQDMVVKEVKGDGYIERKVGVLESDGMKAIINGIDYGTTIISR